MEVGNSSNFTGENKYMLTTGGVALTVSLAVSGVAIALIVTQGSAMLGLIILGGTASGGIVLIAVGSVAICRKNKTIEDELDVDRPGENQIEETTDPSEGLDELKRDQEAVEVNMRNKSNLFTYYISFIPNEDIMLNGTNPLYLIDELHSIGKCIAFPRVHDLPSIDEIDPNKCYTYWDIFVATSEGINTIIDVFIFVDDHCKLEVHKISETDLLDDESFTGIIKGNVQANKSIELSHLQELVRDLEKIFVSKKDKDISSDKLKSSDTVISSIRVSSEKVDSLMNLV